MTGIIGMSCREIARFSEVYDSLMNMNRPEGSRFIQCRSMHGPENWNMLARMVLDEGHDWLFCTEDDHIYHPDTILQLLDSGKDIISGLYLKRDVPFEPIAYHELHDGKGGLRSHFLEDGESGLIEVDAVGVGCLLIRRKVFETVSPPWWILTAPPASPDKINSDVEWCRQAKRHGFQIWLDLDLPVAHVAVMPIFPVRQKGQWATMLSAGNGQVVGFPAAKGASSITRPRLVMP